MWLELIHWPNTRPRDEEIVEMAEWFKERRRSRLKVCRAPKLDSWPLVPRKLPCLGVVLASQHGRNCRH